MGSIYKVFPGPDLSSSIWYELLISALLSPRLKLSTSQVRYTLISRFDYPSTLLDGFANSQSTGIIVVRLLTHSTFQQCQTAQDVVTKCRRTRQEIGMRS
jgi:hypothetical protein